MSTVAHPPQPVNPIRRPARAPCRLQRQRISPVAPICNPSDSDTWNAEVVRLLPTDINLQARSLKAFCRERKIARPTDLLRGLCLWLLNGSVPSFRNGAITSACAGIGDLSIPAWQKRAHQAIPWLAWVARTMLTIPPSAIHPQGYGRVLALDATCLGNTRIHHAFLRLHTAYDLRTGQIDQLHITDERTGEGVAHFTLQEHDIIIADNGYGYRRTVAYVDAQRAFLVIRVRPTHFPLEYEDGSRMDILAELRKDGPSIRVFAGWTTVKANRSVKSPKTRYAVRMIARKLTDKEAAKARKRICTNSKQDHNQVQPETLEIAGWVVVVTTLPEVDWDAAEVLRLYRARWQIELLFKQMKTILQMRTIPGRTLATKRAACLVALIIWAIQIRQMAGIQAQLRKGPTGQWVVSEWAVVMVGIDLIRHQARGAWGYQRLEECLPQLRRLFLHGVRTDRGSQRTDMQAWLAEKCGIGGRIMPSP